MLPQNLSKETHRTQDAIYFVVCVFDSELESSASVVRQGKLLVFIFTVGYAVVSAGFWVREGGLFPLPCLILCFPPRFRCYLIAFCSFVFWMTEPRAVYGPLGILDR